MFENKISFQQIILNNAWLRWHSWKLDCQAKHGAEEEEQKMQGVGRTNQIAAAGEWKLQKGKFGVEVDLNLLVLRAWGGV